VRRRGTERIVGNSEVKPPAGGRRLNLRLARDPGGSAVVRSCWRPGFSWTLKALRCVILNEFHEIPATVFKNRDSTLAGPDGVGFILKDAPNSTILLYSFSISSTKNDLAGIPTAKMAFWQTWAGGLAFGSGKQIDVFSAFRDNR
jgi:hypothetical protein